MAMFAILVLMGLMFPPEVHGVDLEITSFVSNPESPVKDKEGTAENVTLQCQVNLPSTNLTSVTISYPNGVMTNATTTTTPPSPALYEITLSDVHPSNTGNYTCTASASTGSVPTTSQTYQLNVDIDECDSSTCGSNCDTCHTDANCTNTIGSYTCACNAGYNGDGVTCQDIDECDSSTCGSNCDTCHTDATCTNTIGSYTCACNAGYSGNGITCQDINECDPSCSTNCDTCDTDATCTNTIGSYTCACNAGYSGNGVTCQDIDECDSSTCGSNCDTCHTDATCTNTMGSYTCACNAGYSGNGVTCQGNHNPITVSLNS
ncbi:adhesion G protein-coupled receptor E2-like isoform X2 [Acanthaster planci]|uniref:Adhesion G protein-coupled receptor E2-like isoform X2 n=1 Tax=Acanthaster planci TaxID=133434 RepID=A0A8B7ZB90_ACAPL|nr:adhesion G protein-coupled receptor E2-like isoform X2 [Acanthaster planci]